MFFALASWANDALGAAMPPTRSVVKVRRSTMISSLQIFDGRFFSRSFHRAVQPRPFADGFEQRPVALLDDVPLRERRTRLLAERAHHPVVAIIAKQHHADERRQRRCARFSKRCGHFSAARWFEVGKGAARKRAELY